MSLQLVACKWQIRKAVVKKLTTLPLNHHRLALNFSQCNALHFTVKVAIRRLLGFSLSRTGRYRFWSIANGPWNYSITMTFDSMSKVTQTNYWLKTNSLFWRAWNLIERHYTGLSNRAGGGIFFFLPAIRVWCAGYEVRMKAHGHSSMNFLTCNIHDR